MIWSNSLLWPGFSVLVPPCWAACWSCFSCHPFYGVQAGCPLPLQYLAKPSASAWRAMEWWPWKAVVWQQLWVRLVAEGVWIAPLEAVYIHMYTHSLDGWGAEKQQFSAVQCCGWEQVVGWWFCMANIDFNFGGCQGNWKDCAPVFLYWCGLGNSRSCSSWNFRGQIASPSHRVWT